MKFLGDKPLELLGDFLWMGGNFDVIWLVCGKSPQPHWSTHFAPVKPS
ncbi:hypothetical protein [Aquicoccus porphyridii]|nr:hypothetical protein [Aquicoccus porphyridii]